VQTKKFYLHSIGIWQDKGRKRKGRKETESPGFKAGPSDVGEEKGIWGEEKSYGLKVEVPWSSTGGKRLGEKR